MNDLWSNRSDIYIFLVVNSIFSCSKKLYDTQVAKRKLTTFPVQEYSRYLALGGRKTKQKDLKLIGLMQHYCWCSLSLKLTWQKYYHAMCWSLVHPCYWNTDLHLLSTRRLSEVVRYSTFKYPLPKLNSPTNIPPQRKRN